MISTSHGGPTQAKYKAIKEQKCEHLIGATKRKFTCQNLNFVTSNNKKILYITLKITQLWNKRSTLYIDTGPFNFINYGITHS